MEKALDWIEDKCKNNWFPVVAVRDGYAQRVAYVYKLERNNKPTVYYCVESNSKARCPKRIKRICV